MTFPKLDGTFWLVLISAAALFLQQIDATNKNVQQQLEQREQQTKQHDEDTAALSAITQRFGDLVERVQGISLGSTQRFTSLDDALSQISKRVDTIQTSLQNINDRLVIQEAKAQALQDEIKTIVESEKRTGR